MEDYIVVLIGRRAVIGNLQRGGQRVLNRIAGNVAHRLCMLDDNQLAHRQRTTAAHVVLEHVLQCVDEQVDIVHRDTVALRHHAVDLDAHMIQAILDEAPTPHHTVFRVLLALAVLIGIDIFLLAVLLRANALGIGRNAAAGNRHRDDVDGVERDGHRQLESAFDFADDAGAGERGVHHAKGAGIEEVFAQRVVCLELRLAVHSLLGALASLFDDIFQAIADAGLDRERVGAAVQVMGSFVQFAEEHLVADEAANLVLDALGRQIADAVLKLAGRVVIVGGRRWGYSS